MKIYRIDSSPAINKLIARDAAYGFFVYSCLKKFSRDEFGDLLLLSDEKSLTVYPAPLYTMNVAISSDHTNEHTYIQLDSERNDG